MISYGITFTAYMLVAGIHIIPNKDKWRAYHISSLRLLLKEIIDKYHEYWRTQK
jgi:hypothetical protein